MFSCEIVSIARRKIVRREADHQLGARFTSPFKAMTTGLHVSIATISSVSGAVLSGVTIGVLDSNAKLPGSTT